MIELPPITLEECQRASRVVGLAFDEGQSAQDLFTMMRGCQVVYQTLSQHGVGEPGTTAKQIGGRLNRLVAATRKLEILLKESRDIPSVESDLQSGVVFHGWSKLPSIGIPVPEVGEQRFVPAKEALDRIELSLALLSTVVEMSSHRWAVSKTARDMGAPTPLEAILSINIPETYSVVFGARYAPSRTSTKRSDGQPASRSVRFAQWATEQVTGERASQDTVFRAWHAFGGNSH